MKKLTRRCSGWSFGALAAGLLYTLILIGRAPAQDGDPFGACCLIKGECEIVTVLDCSAMGGSYQGDGTMCDACDTHPCCLFDGSCIDDLTQSQCEALDGMFQDFGSFCQEGSVVCIPFGACCLHDGSCVFEFEGNCTKSGGFYFGDATDCAAVDCESIGACCIDGTSCSFIPAKDCAGIDGVYIGDGVACGPFGCVGACCLPDRSCFEDTAAECVSAGGIPQGLFTTCKDVSCLFFQTPVETPAADAALTGSSGELNSPGNTDGPTSGGRDVAVIEPDSGQVQVFVNEGADADGTWLGFDPKPPITVGTQPSDLVVARLDADSFFDMAVPNRGDNTVSILINAGDLLGTFMAGNDIVDPSLNGPVAIAAGDYFDDGLGVIDLVVANAGTNDIAFFQNDGMASFARLGDTMNLGATPTAMDPIDLDNDKDPFPMEVTPTRLPVRWASTPCPWPPPMSTATALRTS